MAESACSERMRGKYVYPHALKWIVRCIRKEYTPSRRVFHMDMLSRNIEGFRKNHIFGPITASVTLIVSTILDVPVLLVLLS